MKKIILFLIAITLLTACGEKNKQDKSESSNSQNNEPRYYSYLDDIDVSNVERLLTKGFSSIDESDPKTLNEAYEYIFLARVLSIDGAVNRFNQAEQASTIGKLEILENIKGNTPKIIPFERYGGYIKVKDYYKGSSESLLEKVNRNRKVKVQDDESYIEVLFSENGNDIHLKAGAVYLMYAYYNTYIKEEPMYAIQGGQYGSLSLQATEESITQVMKQVTRSASEGVVIGKTWKVKNESDGTKQNLGDYLKNIGIKVIER
ncbi:hypothetical protein SAMN02745116_00740 [Pilibacter termitis]|uniref:Lipoprotein n=1 Tax=Pilibacter termitis TaxID=263852 RepID=A0A1T4LNV6_9ENTE|nr:membrane lipoprotein lipid attachment site-containing protein [Pilibacter termitis]SJZ56341.1 hypothetical protein SAMN02745116_00740 [Pilibacter termitis]